MSACARARYYKRRAVRPPGCPPPFFCHREVVCVEVCVSRGDRGCRQRGSAISARRVICYAARHAAAHYGASYAIDILFTPLPYTMPALRADVAMQRYAMICFDMRREPLIGREDITARVRVAQFCYGAPYALLSVMRRSAFKDYAAHTSARCHAPPRDAAERARDYAVCL